MIELGHIVGRAAALMITLCSIGCSSDPAVNPGTDAGTHMDAGRQTNLTTRPDARSTPVARDAARADASPRDAQADAGAPLMMREAPNDNVVLYQSYGAESTCLSVWVAPGSPEDGRVYLRRPCDTTDATNTWRFEPVAGQPQVYNLRSNGYDGEGYCVTSTGTAPFLAIGDCAAGGDRSRWRLSPDPENPARIFQLRNVADDADGTCVSCFDEGDAWCVRRSCWPAEPKFYPSFFTADPAM